MDRCEKRVWCHASGSLPAIERYISSGGEVWLAVAQIPSSTAGTFCGFEGIGTSNPRLVNGFAGWRYYLIAMW